MQEAHGKSMGEKITGFLEGLYSLPHKPRTPVLRDYFAPAYPEIDKREDNKRGLDEDQKDKGYPIITQKLKKPLSRQGQKKY